MAPPHTADNALLMLEYASDDELRAARDSHRGIRQAAFEEQSGVADPAGHAVSCWSQWPAGLGLSSGAVKA
jgi:hypothetical protein